MTRLNIFSDETFVAEGVKPDPLLYPFWREIPKNYYEFPWMLAHQNYAQKCHSLFELTSLEEADLAIMPFNWRTVRGERWRSKINRDRLRKGVEFSKLVESSGKPLVVFFSGDCSDEALPIPSTVRFREAMYRSRRQENDFAIPAFCEDPLDLYFDGQVSVRQKTPKPVVGFCGFSRPSSITRKGQELVYHSLMLSTQKRFGVSPYKGQVLRHKMLESLKKSTLIDANFVIRNENVFLAEKNFDERRNRRLEFMKNMEESVYVLCVRGSGNYSYRFFETLACGRIPVFVDTDCVLPYDFKIDWKKYCVWVDEKDVAVLDEKIAEFHENLSEQEFAERQQECYQLWKKWLSPEGFYSNFHLHFDGISANSNVPSRVL